MLVDPLRARSAARGGSGARETLYLSPQGRRLDQAKVRGTGGAPRLVLPAAATRA